MVLPWWNTKAKGIFVFSVTPFRQRALYGAFTDFGKFIKSMFLQPGIFIAAPMVGGAAYLVHYMKEEYIRIHRKDPQQYENEFIENKRQAELSQTLEAS